MPQRKKQKRVNQMENKIHITDGLLRDNTVLSAGMIISPVIICTTSFRDSLALVYAFSVITFLSDVLAYFIPKKFPYALRVICISAISSLFYVPVRELTMMIYPQSVERIGIYFPLIAVNSLIVYQTQNRFLKLGFRELIGNLVFYILGFDVVMLVSGALRELIAYGTINNKVMNISMTIEGAGLPFGGFIILGIMCGIYRKIRSAGKD